jgi:hypothetical protein
MHTEIILSLDLRVHQRYYANNKALRNMLSAYKAGWAETTTK